MVHEGKVCELQCLTCKIPYCTKCAAKHKSHDVLDFEDYFKMEAIQRENAVDIIEKLRKKSEAHIKDLDYLTAQKEQDINSTFNKINSILKKTKDNIIANNY